LHNDLIASGTIPLQSLLKSGNVEKQKYVPVQILRLILNLRLAIKMRMTREERVSAGIKSVIDSMMKRVLDKVLIEDPFLKEKHHASKPMYAALVPDEIFKGSHFERRFVTPFGRVWENLAQVVANEAHGQCATGHVLIGTIREERLRRIQEVLNRLEHSNKGQLRFRPDWKAELAYILEGGGTPIPATVVCDLLVNNVETGARYAFELKGPLPNSDQTKVSKEKMFKLLAMDDIPVDGAYFALPYNPYGKRADYTWQFATRWFDMRNDLWDFIGGSGTYATLISEVNSLGKEYRARIYKEFLGIVPPADANDYLLR